MITYTPKISVKATHSRSRDSIHSVSFRISCFLPSCGDFVAKGKSALIVLPESATIEIDLVSTSSEQSYRVMVSGSGEEESAKELGVIDFEVLPAKEDVTGLRNAIQMHFFDAISDAYGAMRSEVASSTGWCGPVQPEQMVEEEPKRKKLKIALALMAVLSIGWGTYTHFATSVDEPMGIALGDDYSDVSARVKAQVNAAARSGQPAVNTLAGQNVALETMRAMGLDPGKANAGCLVGVK